MQQIHALSGIVIIVLTAFILFSVIAWSLAKLQKYKKEAWAQLSLYSEVTAKEKDRARMKEQLHEDFAQTLAAIRMYMNRFNLTEEEDIELRQQAVTYVDDVITKIRGIALEYLPYSIGQGKLKHTLENYTQYINTHYHNLISLRVNGEIPALSDQQTINLYRIIQEITDNTLKHAQATALIINIQRKENQLLVITQDNGVGFDYDAELRKERGLGLNTMLTRIQLLKGKMKVNSGKGGTLYGMEIPI